LITVAGAQNGRSSAGDGTGLRRGAISRSCWLYRQFQGNFIKVP